MIQFIEQVETTATNIFGKNARQIVLFARYLVKFIGSFEKLFNA